MSNTPKYRGKKWFKYLRILGKHKYLTVTNCSSSPGYACSSGGEETIPVEIFRRLRDRGFLTPRNDGLFDGCSQTYTVADPGNHANADSGVQALPEIGSPKRQFHR